MTVEELIDDLQGLEFEFQDAPVVLGSLKSSEVTSIVSVKGERMDGSIDRLVILQ
jgi:hypothetical protein